MLNQAFFFAFKKSLPTQNHELRSPIHAATFGSFVGCSGLLTTKTFVANSISCNAFAF